jgi:broad specificity phosphatase PhoE
MAKPKRIIIVRHGESQSNADKSTRGKIQDHKIGLTDKGKLQAETVGHYLREEYIGCVPVGFWVSPFNRTRETAEKMLLAFKKQDVAWVREDPRIREQEWGHLRAPDIAQQINDERDAYSRFWYRIPDGESGADVFDRIATFLETLHRDFRKPDHPENLILVSHGYTSRIILMKWLHYSVEEFEAAANPPNCGFYVLELQADERYKLVESGV